jgi:hypothetical protein
MFRAMNPRGLLAAGMASGFLKMQQLPRTPSEIAELHGFDPISVGGAGEFSQVWVSNLVNVSNSLQASMSASFIKRKIYTYLFMRTIDPAKDAWITTEYSLYNGNSLAAKFPLANIEYNAFSATPPDNLDQYVQLGCNSATATPSENVICVRWSHPDAVSEPVRSSISPITLEAPISILKLQVREQFNCAYRAWVGCLSTT